MNVAVIYSHLTLSDAILSRISAYSIFHVIHINYGRQFLDSRKGLRKWIKWCKLKKIYNGRKIICVSEGVQKDLLEHVNIRPEFIDTVYNPISYSAISQKASLNADIPVKDYIINVSGFREQKRHDILLKAFARSGIGCHLVLLGTGSEKDIEKIKKMAMQLNIHDKVIMPGFHKNPYPWMKKAKLFVLSSDFEGLSLVIVESIFCGTPVISTDCPSGPSEILKDYPDLLSPVGDFNQLGKKIRYYYENPPKIHIDRHFAKFFPENVVNTYEKLTIKNS